MQSRIFAAVSVAILLSFSARAEGPSDDEIRQILVEASLASYEGNCPCPESRDRSGRRCGKRSAYAKPGGSAPLCYPTDVTDKMIAKYKARVPSKI